MNYKPVSLTYSLELVPLGRNFYWKCKILVFWLVLFIKRHVKISSRSPWFFKLIHLETPFYFYLTDEIDIQSLVGVVLRGEYEFALKKIPAVIVDLGSNIGTSILYFKLLYPDAQIYGFEPNPYIFSVLGKNVSQFNNVFVQNLAASSHSGEVKLFIDKGKSSSSSIVRGDDSYHIVDVKSLDLDAIKMAAGGKIDLLKFDIEGAEELVFSKEKLKGISNVVGEVHLGLMSVSEEEFLKSFDGYNVVIERRDEKYFILRAKIK